MAPTLGPVVRGWRPDAGAVVHAGPLETVIPWHWDWFDDQPPAPAPLPLPGLHLKTPTAGRYVCGTVRELRDLADVMGWCQDRRNQ